MNLSLWDQPWLKNAACKGMDPSLFYPDKASHVDPIAIRVCARCPVEDECLEYALEQGPSLLGYWGGTSQKRRRIMLRERRYDASRASTGQGREDSGL